MTIVHLSMSVPTADGTSAPATGSLRFTPTARRVIVGAPDVVVLPKMFIVPLVAGVADVTLEPTTGAWLWRVDEFVAGAPARTIHVAVPDVAEVDYPDLVAVDPATLLPTAAPEPAWVAMAASTVTTGAVVADDLILTRTDGTSVNAGRVAGEVGPQGIQGEQGIQGIQGLAGLTGATGLTGPQGIQGIQGIQGEIGPAGSPTAYELRGTGMPNSVVTAAVGTYYTDTAGTNGAWRWLKTSGTGNTGWTVTVADTGWRLVNDWALDSTGAANTVTGSVYVRRIGDIVTYAVNRATFTAGLYLNPSSGFRPQTGRVGTFPWEHWDSTAVRALYWSGTRWFPSSGTQWLANAQTSTAYTHYTPDAWPTTLPGTAA